ncbi:hypothetical protein [Streptomyces sp. NPDC050564]|uniref:hypothetical protein n=1 Tax=Streptomyces sp. NPDC050564 TaxID=3365631 RepID=UPI00378B7984
MCAHWRDGLVVHEERIAEIAAYYQALDEGATLRHHFCHADEEEGFWYIEAAPDRGNLIVIKQAELTSADQLHQYSWEHLKHFRREGGVLPLNCCFSYRASRLGRVR